MSEDLVFVHNLRVKMVGPDAPKYATPFSAGLDLYADAYETLDPGQRRLIPTGIAVALPPGTVGLICPRSGLALGAGVTVLNAPGVIDEDYRGVVGVVLINHGTEPFKVRRGDRIAQMLVVPVLRPEVRVVSFMEDTVRGPHGFGSTGK